MESASFEIEAGSLLAENDCRADWERTRRLGSWETLEPLSFFSLNKANWPFLCLWIAVVIGMSVICTAKVTWSIPLDWSKPATFMERFLVWIESSGGWDPDEGLAGETVKAQAHTLPLQQTSMTCLST